MKLSLAPFPNSNEDSSPRPTWPVSRHPSGFALIVTINLMILLAVIAVGLLSLSSISLRSVSSTQAMSEARQNARLAMMLAIAQLQSLTGPDTRVTASSKMMDDAAVTATGVWRSWEGSNHDSEGRAIIPQYDSKFKPGDPAMEIAASSDGRFLGWLTSTSTASDPDVMTIPNAASTNTPGMVPMVSTGSVDPEAKDPDGKEMDQQVFITPTMLDGSKGAIAWWTSGDNAKAMVNADSAPKPAKTTDWQQRVRSNGRADAESFGLGKIDEDTTIKLLPSTGSLQLVNPSADLKKFHDLTAYSPGLLTNTATGGWRKDLSLMSENYISLPDTGLPFFTVAPGKDLLYSKTEPGGNPLPYHWDNYRTGGWWGPTFPPISSWNALVNFTQQYRNLPANGSSERTAMKQPLAFGFPDDRVKFNEEVRRVPQLARLQWIYSIGSRKAPGGDPSAPIYNPGIIVTPVLTLWNPFNVEMTAKNYWVAIRYQPNPLEFVMKHNGGEPWKFASRNFMSDKIRINEIYFHLLIKDSFTLAPGATMIFSTGGDTPVVNPDTTDFHLVPGYTPGGGYLYTKIGPTKNEIAAAASESFEITQVIYEKTDVREWGGVGEGLGMFFNVLVNADNLNTAGYSDDTGTAKYITPHRMRVAPFSALGGDPAFSKIYPPITSSVSAPVSTIDVDTSKGAPFATALFGYRVVSPFFIGDKYKYKYSKGMLQSNPFCGYTEGTGHPLRASYDFAFKEMDGWNNTDVVPQFEAATNRTYIVSGLTAGNGLTRCIMVELPTRPIQSLAELQHFDAQNNSQNPPHQLNLIGNGSAHPLFLPNQVFGGDRSNDDTYLLNHLLFDDWFVSSIADDVTDFGSSVERTAEQVYRDHLTLAQPLPNRLYQPAPGAASPNLNDAVAEAAVSGTKAGIRNISTGKYPFESIASKLHVNGMFNINSVSRDAWKAVLRQSRDTQVPYLATDGSTQPGEPTSFSFPRTSIAGDQGSDSGSKESNALFPDAAEFAGHRVLTDVQIDALAEQIVSEIKKRGPFLSLAEFVNRQITTDKDLAIASTIQKALDDLAKLGPSAKNPFTIIQAIAPEIEEAPPGNHGYQFPEAALGSSAFGVPGWVRQADILRPIAPIMSARDDTFTIRAYGDSRDKTGKVLAKAWCEATVTRQAEYVDPSDPAAVAPLSDFMNSEANRRFGRRYQIVSFRWLAEPEI